MVKFAALFLLVIVAGAAMAAPAHAPVIVRIKGLGVLAVGLFGGAAFFYRATTGAFVLTFGETGFTQGRKYYAWADIGPFTQGSGRNRSILYFTHAGKRRSLVNLYGMSGPALADLLNRQRAEHGGGFVPGARPELHPSLLDAPAARRTLPPAVWLFIITIFIILLATGEPMAEALWYRVSPASYAAHLLLNDQDLADRAGHDPRLLPVLLARAHAGDKSAMYFMGDLYDPTDFLCESTVGKNAATAVYWYAQAVPLDDEGAERALGVLYLYGIGVPQSDATAATLLELSVTHHNDDIGDFELGRMLETGRGEPLDMGRAVQLEKASAAQNNAWGETELGRMYALGIGVTQDMGQARKYWRQAAAQGDAKAQNWLKRYQL